MKILFFTNHYLRDEEMMGGVNIYLTNIVDFLIGQKHKVIVIEKESMGLDEIHTDFLTVIPLQLNSKIEIIKRFLKYLLRFFGRIFPFFDLKFNNSLDFLANSVSFTKQISQFSDLDIVQLTNLESIGCFLPTKRNYRLLIRASSYREYWDKANEVPSTRDYKTIQTLENLQYKRADNIFAPSKYLASIVSQKIRKPVLKISSPVHVNFNNWDNTLLRQYDLDNKDYILYFGILSKRKGIFDLVNAMNLVWDSFPTLDLVAIGPDYKINGVSNLERMKAELISPFKDEKFIYHSELPHSLLFPIIHHARFVVLPSIYDNCPNSLIESMEIGKPIISTYDSGNDEFFPVEYKHLLVTKNDSTMLANRIIELNHLSDQELQIIGEIFKENIAKTNSLELIAYQLIDLYQDIDPNSHSPIDYPL